MSNDLSQHVIQFIENLNLVGDHNGLPFKLRNWQKDFIERLYKTDRSGNLITSKCLLMLPRKNSKSTLIAAICLYTMLCYRSQQVLIAASSESQGKRVLEIMAEMILQDPTLKELCEISKTRISCEATFSFAQVVTSGGNVNHGYNPSLVVMDELHCWNEPKHKKLYASLTTGSGTRTNPLTICITTQTSDRNSLTAELFDYACRLKNRFVNGKIKRSGEYENQSFFACLYYADQKADWTSSDVWRACNPALGDFLNESYLEKEFILAQQLPSKQSSFRQFYLNTPLDGMDKWMDMLAWEKLKDDPKNLEQYPCYLGVDIAPVNDLSAGILLFDLGDSYHVKSFFWCSKDSIEERSKVEQVPYDLWAKQNHIIAQDLPSTNYDLIAQDLIEFCEPYRVKSVSADRNHGYEVAYKLQNHGYVVEWYRPFYEPMSKPTNRLEKLVKDKTITHDGNPVLDYCLSNVILESDAVGNVRPSNTKRRDQDKIDGAIALLYALGVAIWEQPEEFESEDCSIFL